MMKLSWPSQISPQSPSMEVAASTGWSCPKGQNKWHPGWFSSILHASWGPAGSILVWIAKKVREFGIFCALEPPPKLTTAHEICATGTGINLLLHGQPGTGKKTTAGKSHIQSRPSNLYPSCIFLRGFLFTSFSLITYSIYPQNVLQAWLAGLFCALLQVCSPPNAPSDWGEMRSQRIHGESTEF